MPLFPTLRNYYERNNEMDITASGEITYTIKLKEREAKILASLVGALSPTDAEEIAGRSLHYKEWIGSFNTREMTEFTGCLYDGLFELF